jgi:hypothetical protein
LFICNKKLIKEFNLINLIAGMEIIEKLPDDIVLYIYTKILKRYRFYKGDLIKLIDVDKYSFLEKYTCRRITRLYQTASMDANEKKYRIDYCIPNVSEIYNRKDLHIDDDMICMELTENDNNNSLHYEISRFRLKWIDNINNENLPSIYYKGELADYEWDVVSYSYNI